MRCGESQIHLVRRLALVCFWLALLLTGCNTEQEAAETLVFEVDRPAAGLAADAPLDRLPDVVRVLTARLGDEGRVRADDQGLIHVEVFEELADADFLRLVARLEASGSLEFRVLANANFAEDANIIEQAAALGPAEKSLSNEDGVVARWIPLAEGKPQLVVRFKADWTPDADDDGARDGEEGPRRFTNPSGFAVRTIAEDAESPRHEILVLQDPCDVTGKDLERVLPGLIDNECSVDFKLTDDGARRFGLLTRDSQPTPDGFKRHLGILLNGSLNSAPTINSVITQYGQITGYRGPDGEQERDDVIRVLQSGELPYPIRLMAASDGTSE